MPSLLCGSPDIQQQLPEWQICLVLSLITSLLREKKKDTLFLQVEIKQKFSSSSKLWLAALILNKK